MIGRYIFRAKAQEIDAIVLSLNGDFADIVNYPPKNYKGIVALQMRACNIVTRILQTPRWARRSFR